jgi:AcrR family transcriptional regulator
MKRNDAVPLVTSVSSQVCAAVEIIRRPRADVERNRRIVLDAAQRVLVSNPNPTMDELVAATGLGRTTVFRHFATKEALLLAVHEEVLEEVERQLASMQLDTLPAIEALSAILDVAFALPQQFPFVCADPAEFTAASPEVLHRVEALVGQAQVIIERGQAAGSLDPNVPAQWLALAFFRLTEAMITSVGNDTRPGFIELANAKTLVLKLFIRGSGK